MVLGRYVYKSWTLGCWLNLWFQVKPQIISLSLMGDELEQLVFYKFNAMFLFCVYYTCQYSTSYSSCMTVLPPPPPPICRLHPYLSYHWCRTLNEQYLLSKVQCFLLFVLFFKCPPRGSRNKSTDSYVAWLLRTFSVVEKWWRSLTFELVWDIPHIHQLYHFIANKPFSDLFDLAK